MRVLSLFSGGGLGDYGLELAGMEIVGQVEIDDYCQKILKLRWPEVQKWRDVRDVKGQDVLERCGRVDLISGGFPCQDISQAGRGAGIGGARSGLWKEMLRIICEVRPRYVLVENVAILLGRGLGVVLGDLAESGYDAEYDCIPASAVGAPHQRDRIWIIAYPKSIGTWKDERGLWSVSNGHCEGVQANDVANSSSKRLEGQFRSIFEGSGVRPSNCGWWAAEPNVGRVAHGVAKRVDRLKLLGNGQVVQVVQWIGERILEYEKQTS